MREIAVITGASTGIGRELARCCAEHGYDVVIAADEPQIHTVARELEGAGVTALAVEADLATDEGVDRLVDAIPGDVTLLMANVGRGLGHAFLDQEFEEVRHVVDTNVTGTLDLVQRVGRRMRQRGAGRILFTGSIAGFMPGTFNAVYNGTKAFIDSFAVALRHELQGSGVSVTCLMPGATETEFFARADMLDTKVGQGEKDDAADVARVGFDALMRGDSQVVYGWHNKAQAAMAHVMSADRLAEMHRKKAEPGGAD